TATLAPPPPPQQRATPTQHRTRAQQLQRSDRSLLRAHYATRGRRHTARHHQGKEGAEACREGCGRLNHSSTTQIPLTTTTSSTMIITMNTLPKPYTGVPGFNVDEPPPWSKPAPDRSLLENFELIQDLARYGEGLFTRDQVK